MYRGIKFVEVAHLKFTFTTVAFCVLIPPPRAKLIQHYRRGRKLTIKVLILISGYARILPSLQSYPIGISLSPNPRRHHYYPKHRRRFLPPLNSLCVVVPPVL